ncbi:MFS transporter [Mucilaginibacter sp. PAMB04168]|uniref:MFS transporter n=1 Tax=Mucilaginibacter sp. PAMB04168 TaxID=3138567 RepID=UPI0031F7053A
MELVEVETKITDKRIWPLLLQAPVIVAALGYFVDIYDLLLFSIVRISSLQGIGVASTNMMNDGILLINVQMIGLLLGGILWGILGDKKGRLSVLFGSILIYSVANIMNGMVTSITQYAILRFVAGVGLAGELGAGITLVAEILPKKVRGYGTAMVASVGLLGAVLAYFVAKYFDWRTTYYIGGGLGMLLLLLRISVAESHLYQATQQAKVEKGNILILFTSAKRFFKYIRCIAIGLPIWFVIGILITFSPELSHAMGLSFAASSGTAVMYCYIGMAIGDISSGLVSQYLNSRKKAVALFMAFTMISIALYLTFSSASSTYFYAICLVGGFSIGFWAMFVTIAAEQFGTNLRSTVATTVPNFVRGAVVPLTYFFQQLGTATNLVTSAWIVGLVTLALAALALWQMEETFGKDLNYTE